MKGKSLGFYILFPVALSTIMVTGCPPLDRPSGDNGGPPPEPEIELWQNGTPVGLGSNCDLGSVCITTASVVTFTVENVGTADLNLSGAPEKVAKSGVDASLFEVTSQPASPIAQNDSAQFSIRFSPDSSGGKTATFSIPNDDQDANPFTFTITAIGIVPPAKIPATGQTTSYATGDDGNLGMGVSWPVSRFIENQQDDIVTDTLTGLMWERSPSGTGRPWSNAVIYANNLALGGHTDWRLANIIELQSLINPEQSNPAGWLNGQGFSGARSDDYWSSTTSASNPAMAFVLRTDEGGAVGRTTKGILNPEYVWAVRDGQSGEVSLPKTRQTTSYATGDDGNLEMGVSWPSPRFRDNGNGTITDNLTGLVWEKYLSGTKSTWADALTYANDLTVGEYSDWRLANKNELRSLIHHGHSNSASGLGSQGFINVQADIYWTSTTYAGDTTLAWVVYMETGNMGYSSSAKTTGNYYAWAVRGGQ